MTQYINKDALVAEIESYISNYKDILARTDRNDAVWVDFVSNVEAKIDVLQHLLTFIDTIEVKEVDLEDSVKGTLRQKYIDYTFKRHNIDPESREGLLIYYAYMHGMNQCLEQLKAQNEHKSCTTDE
jgi:hypothetical protein